MNGVPAFLALIVGLMVWRRHPVDRRARVFLALSASELAFLLPTLLVRYVPQTPLVMAVLDGLVIGTALLSAILFLHFGLVFPHARPWLRSGWMTSLYAAAAIAGVIPIATHVGGLGSSAAAQDVFDSVLILGGPLLLVALVTACLAMYRSYREMTTDERARYRLPVLGVLVSMIAGVVTSLVLGLMFGLVLDGTTRVAVLTTNTLAMLAELLLPMFFFMAVVRYGLLAHHSQDFAAPPRTTPHQ